ncbi:hypothetical protein GQ54DRAFT_178224 [Martensiomyces pterosporus]|nr:hypothetical protein GQ54DRAFT_178224 [Martensiomyces pterosporus]
MLDLFRKIDFAAMRAHATTYQGKKVVDNLEKSTDAGVRVVEELNGDDNVQEIIRSLNSARKRTVEDRKKLLDNAKKESKESTKNITSAGKDFLTIAKGIGTSAALRKSITDITSLASATIRNKAPKVAPGAAKEAEEIEEIEEIEDMEPGQEAELIKKELKSQKGSISAAAYDAIQPLAARVRAGEMTASKAASTIMASSKEKLSSLVEEGKQELSRDNLKHLVERLRDIILEVREEPSVQEALSSMASLYTTTYKRGVAAAKSVTGKVKAHPATEDLSDTERRVQDIFSRLGNGYELGPIFAAVAALGREYKNSPDIRQLLDDTREFGSWAVKLDPDELMSDEFTLRSKDILTRSKKVFGKEGGKHFDTISKGTKEYMEAVQHNPVLVSYKDAMVGLAYSVFGKSMDAEERKEHFKALRNDVLTNLTLLVSSIRYIPVPRVAGQNKELEFAADNLVLDLKRFVPERISMDYHTEVYPRSVLLKNSRAMVSRKGFHGEQFFYITITGINCVAKSVAFYVKKKKGIPRVAEKGIADLVIGGRGMDITIRVRKLHDSEKSHVPAKKPEEKKESGKSKSKSKSKDRDERHEERMRPERQFDIVSVTSKLHDLEIKVHHNKHNVLSTLAIPLIKPAAKKLVAKNIAKTLSDALVRVDKTMSKYGNVATVFVSSTSKQAMATATSTIKKGAKFGKKKHGKTKEKSAEQAVAKDEVPKVKEEAGRVKVEANAAMPEGQDLESKARHRLDSAKDKTENKLGNLSDAVETEAEDAESKLKKSENEAARAADKLAQRQAAGRRDSMVDPTDTYPPPLHTN